MKRLTVLNESTLVCRLVAVLGILNVTGQAPAADSVRPNIVFILADDLGYRELGSFGQQKILTPHLDGLATQGMRLRQHYSGNAVCAPSRCVLMTGLHPGHAHVRDNSEMQPEGQKPLLDAIGAGPQIPSVTDGLSLLPLLTGKDQPALNNRAEKKQ